jgi:hypothetical protein
MGVFLCLNLGKSGLKEICCQRANEVRQGLRYEHVMSSFLSGQGAKIFHILHGFTDICTETNLFDIICSVRP